MQRNIRNEFVLAAAIVIVLVFAVIFAMLLSTPRDENIEGTTTAIALVATDVQALTLTPSETFTILEFTDQPSLTETAIQMTQLVQNQTMTADANAATSTAIAAVTATFTPTQTLTLTATVLPSATHTVTQTPVPPTSTATETDLPTETEPAVPSATTTASATVTATQTATATSSASPTATNSATATQTPTVTPTNSPTNTATHTATFTSTATSTATPTSTPTPTNTPTPTATLPFLGILPTPPPSPTVANPALPTRTASTCVQPAGWSAYRVSSGDTLFEIALATGSTLDELRYVNCIGDVDNITAGDVIFVPRLPIGPVSTVVAGGVRPGLAAIGCVDARTQITSPTTLQRYSGIFSIYGTAVRDDFWYYKIEIRPDTASIYNFYMSSYSQVTNSLLAQLNSEIFGDGVHWLRLTVVDITANIQPDAICEIPVIFD